MASGRGGIGTSTSNSDVDVGNEDGPSLIAHRGFADEHPENTLTAFRAAARSADRIELDCRPIAEGACAVFHDARFDRCTDRSGLVAETPASEVFSTPVRGGGSIPTLEETLEAIPVDTGVVLDLKGRHGAVPTAVDERWEWLEGPLATAAGTPHATLVSTFWEGALEATERYAPELPTAYLFERDADRALEIAERHGCEAIHPPVELLLGEGSAVDAGAFLARARERELAVNVWTVTSREEAAALAALGVDGLIADRADVDAGVSTSEKGD